MVTHRQQLQQVLSIIESKIWASFILNYICVIDFHI